MADPLLEAFVAGGGRPRRRDDDPLAAAFNEGRSAEWEGSFHQMEEPGAFTKFTDRLISGESKLANPLGRMVNRVGSNLMGLAEAAVNPLDTLGAIRDKTTDELVNLQMAAREGDPLEATRAGIAAIPVVGAGIESAANDLSEGNIPELVGDAMTARTLQVGGKVARAGGAAVKEAAGAVPDALRRGGERVYRGALKPQSDKVANKAVPRMMDEGITPHQDLTPQIATAVKRVEDLQYKYRNVTQDTSDVFRSVLATGSQFLDKAPDGRTIPLNPKALAYIKQSAEDIAASSVGGKIATGNLVRWRSEFGRRAVKGHAFDKDLPPQTQAALDEAISNALSERINRANPELGTANGELSFLLDADKLAQGAPKGAPSVMQDFGMMAAFGFTPYRIGKTVLDTAARFPGTRARIGLGMDRLGRAMGGQKEWPSDPFSPRLAAETANQPKALPPSPVAGALGPAPQNAPEGFVSSDDLRRVGTRVGHTAADDSAVFAAKSDPAGMTPPDIPPPLPGVKPQPLPEWMARSLQSQQSNLLGMLQKQDIEAIRKGIVTRDMVERLARQGIDLRAMNPEDAHGWLARKLVDQEYKKATMGAPTLADILAGKSTQ